MCGILALLGSFNTPDVTKINQVMSHRGPDNFSYASGKNFCFFHSRLSIVGLDNNANQPVRDDKGNVLVYNGEIYNHRQLCRKYGIEDLGSDTLALFNLLVKFGDSVISELDGMFAFVFIKANDLCKGL